MSPAKEIENRGWRQFSVISHSSAKTLSKKYGVDWYDNRVLILITQSCDLTHYCFDDEPFAELISTKDGNKNKPIKV